MARARLMNPERVDGGTAYQVDAWPFGDPPFTAPAERNWSDFVVISSSEARFTWRTPADRLRATAEAVAAGTWTLDDARQEEAVARWLAGHRAEYVELLEQDDPAPANDDELDRQMLLDIGQHLDNAEGLFGYYKTDDDQYLLDAANALDLPPWARVMRTSAGGPGTGFMAVTVVLDPGRDLNALEESLNAGLSRDGA